MTQPFASYSTEIYLHGLGGTVPELPCEAGALERLAEARLGSKAFNYVFGGAASESTVRANREAFERWRLIPRMLRDVAERDTRRTVLGTELPAPFLLAPVGVQSILHPDAELATARAAAGLGTPVCLSTASSTTLEDVAAAMGDTPRWFQLYWPKDRDVAASLLARAAGAGYRVLVVTLDTWLVGWRPRDLDAGYLPFLGGEGIANYTADPAFRAGLASPPEQDPQAAVLHWAGMFGDPANTWDDLEFVRDHWQGPIVLKGVLHPDDARRAADAGMDGVVVSNHGGRQVDGAIAALDALPPVVAAVGDTLTVLVDSGVRTGADILKALALGARAALIGRPYAYALALGGEAGVRHLLRSLLADFDLSMALCGYRSPDEVDAAAITRAG